MKAGDRVSVIDGQGETLVPVATVERYAPGAGIVFVREGSDGNGLLYGLPTSMIAPVPSPRVVRVLRETFGLREIDKPKPENRIPVARTFNVPTPADAASIGWRMVRWFWGLAFLSLIVAGLVI